MMPRTAVRLAQKEQAITQELSSQLVLLNVQDGQYYRLDPVGRRVWSLCDGTRGVTEIVEVLRQEYDASADTIRTDVVALLEDLLRADLVEAR
jgi:Coenzyme PQQ synthesis protein D (PqqD)